MNIDAQVAHHAVLASVRKTKKPGKVKADARFEPTCGARVQSQPQDHHWGRRKLKRDQRARAKRPVDKTEGESI
jgi:hypothetical protein